MNLPQGISILPITDWENVHENFHQTFMKDASFKLDNVVSAGTSSAQYRITTSNIQWLIQNAISNNRQLRAMGSGWSLSDVAVSSGGIIDTKSLRLSFALNNSFVSQQYLAGPHQAGDLFFAQCGMSVLQLHAKLEGDRKRSLKACGASNGQSIAGATSTGTHGAGFRVGALHDSIVGMHIITGPGRHVWLERKSYPVVSDQFVQWLGAEAISDDDIFNAAVVSFGSFGVIHGIMIETEPVFLLEKYCSDRLAYTDMLKNAISTVDFSGITNLLPLPWNGPDKNLYHFEVVINPNQFEANNADKGVFIRSMYKKAYAPDYPKTPVNENGSTYGDDMLGFISTVLDKLGSLGNALVPTLVNKMFPLAYSAADKSVGTLGETFVNTRFRGKVCSAAIAVDCADADKVMQIIIAQNKKTVFPGGLAMRFVKGTQATLGFTKFPKTCVLEMDGVDCAEARNFFTNVWQQLDARKIPYTEHWGKMNFNLTPQLVTKMYGADRIQQWKNARNKLLDTNTQKVFTNDFLVRAGLA
ncbi:FAD-binding protein [Chitinophagaceae bacterium MMS25-I14]